MQFSPSEREIITEKIAMLLDKGIIEQIDRVQGDFISTIFVCPKKN